MNCSNHGTWSGSIDACICNPQWIFADCSVNWSRYNDLYWSFKWTFESLYICLFLFALYRFIRVTTTKRTFVKTQIYDDYMISINRGFVSASTGTGIGGSGTGTGHGGGGGNNSNGDGHGTHAVGTDELASRKNNTHPLPNVTATITGSASPRIGITNVMSNGFGKRTTHAQDSIARDIQPIKLSLATHSIRWYQDQQLVILALITTTCLVYILIFVDPLSIEGIYPILVMRTMYVVASLCIFSSAGFMIRFFMKIQAKFHPPTRRVIKALDACTVLLYMFNVGALVIEPYDDSLSQTLGNLVSATYALLLVAGSSVYSVTILQQLVRKSREQQQQKQQQQQQSDQRTISGTPMSSPTHVLTSPTGTFRSESLENHSHVDSINDNPVTITSTFVTTPIQPLILGTTTMSLTSPPSGTQSSVIGSSIGSTPNAGQWAANSAQRRLADQLEVERAREAKILIRIVRSSQIFAIAGVVIIILELAYEKPYIVPVTYIALESSIRLVEMAVLVAVLMVMGKTKGMQVVPARTNTRDSDNGNTTFQSGPSAKANKDYAHAIQVHNSIFRRQPHSPPPERVYHTEHTDQIEQRIQYASGTLATGHQNIVPQLSMSFGSGIDNTASGNSGHFHAGHANNADLTIDVNATADVRSESADSSETRDVITLLPNVVHALPGIVTIAAAKIHDRGRFALKRTIVVSSSEASSPLSPLTPPSKNMPSSPSVSFSSSASSVSSSSAYELKRPAAPVPPFKRGIPNQDSDTKTSATEEQGQGQYGQEQEHCPVTSPRLSRVRNPRASISINKKPPPLPLFTTLSNGSLAVLVSPRTGKASYISHTGMGSRTTRHADTSLVIPHTVNDHVSATVIEVEENKDTTMSSFHSFPLKRHTSLVEEDRNYEHDHEHERKDEYGLHKNITDLDMDAQHRVDVD